MTVPSTTRRAGPYLGNGVTTSFPFAFKVFAKTDVAVILTDSNGAATTLVLDSDYGVTLNADQDANPGGSITYPILVGPAPLPIGSTLTTVGGLEAAQSTDLTNGGRFLPQVVENALDKLTILIQQLKEVSNRTLQAAVGTTVSLIFPAPSSGKFIRWRSDLLGLENVDAGTDSMVLQGLLADASDPTHGAALIGYKLNKTGAVGRTLAAKLAERVSVRDFGAVGNGIADDTAAINAALAASVSVYFPAGTYKISGTIALTQTGHTLIGEAMRLVTITSTSANLPNISLLGGVANFRVQEMIITKSVAGTLGGDGVVCLGTTNSSVLRDLEISNCYNGLSVGTCDEGVIQNVTCRANWQNGIFMTNSSGYGPAQWKLDRILVAMNALDGLRVQSTNGPPGLILGTWQNVETFANSGRGIHLLGSAVTPIYDLRINQGFIGADNGGGVRVDSYGGKHRIVSCFVERSGLDATGPGLATPPSNASDGIEVTVNNTDCSISSCLIDENTRNGIRQGGGILSVVGCQIYNNGAALTAGVRNGIISTGGRLVVSGNFITNVGSALQEFGIATTHSAIVASGNDLTGNANSAYTLGASPSQNTIILGNANFGTFQHSGTTIFDLVMQNARTPGMTNVANDTINVAGGLYKAGVAYSNP